MISASVTSNVASVLKRIDKFQTGISKAGDAALNKLAFDLRKHQQNEMKANFDNPVNYTLNSILARTTKAAGDSSKAGVYFRERAGGTTDPHKYLTPQIKGGPRRFKAHERKLFRLGVLPAGKYTVPGKDAPLNGNGNINGGIYRKLLADIESALFVGPQPKGKRKRLRRYFPIYRNGEAIAIAEKTGNSLSIVLAFTSKPQYQKKYDFYGTSEAFVLKNFERTYKQILRNRTGI